MIELDLSTLPAFGNVYVEGERRSGKTYQSVQLAMHRLKMGSSLIVIDPFANSRLWRNEFAKALKAAGIEADTRSPNLWQIGRQKACFALGTKPEQVMGFCLQPMTVIVDEVAAVLNEDALSALEAYQGPNTLYIFTGSKRSFWFRILQLGWPGVVYRL